MKISPVAEHCVVLSRPSSGFSVKGLPAREASAQVYLKVAGRGLAEAALSNPARALLRRHEDL